MIAELDALIAAAEKVTPSKEPYWTTWELGTMMEMQRLLSPAVVIALARVAKSALARANDECSSWPITQKEFAMINKDLCDLASAIASGGDK